MSVARILTLSRRIDQAALQVKKGVLLAAEAAEIVDGAKAEIAAIRNQRSLDLEGSGGGAPGEPAKPAGTSASPKAR